VLKQAVLPNNLPEPVLSIFKADRNLLWCNTYTTYAFNLWLTVLCEAFASRFLAAYPEDVFTSRFVHNRGNSILAPGFDTMYDLRSTQMRPDLTRCPGFLLTYPLCAAQIVGVYAFTCTFRSALDLKSYPIAFSNPVTGTLSTSSLTSRTPTLSYLVSHQSSASRSASKETSGRPHNYNRALWISSSFHFIPILLFLRNQQQRQPK